MLAKHVAREPVLEIGGQRYRLSTFNRRCLRSFMEWANERLGSPLDDIKALLPTVAPNVQEMLVKDALEKARQRRDYNSPEMQSIANTVEGSMKILYLLFAKYHPNLTDQQIDDLLDLCIEERGVNYITQVIHEASGELPQNDSDVERQALQEFGAIGRQPIKKKASSH